MSAYAGSAALVLIALSMLFFSAGTLRMPTHQFLIFDGILATATAPILRRWKPAVASRRWTK